MQKVLCGRRQAQPFNQDDFVFKDPLESFCIKSLKVPSFHQLSSYSTMDSDMYIFLKLVILQMTQKMGEDFLTRFKEAVLRYNKLLFV